MSYRKRIEVGFQKPAKWGFSPWYYDDKSKHGVNIHIAWLWISIWYEWVGQA